MSKHHIGIEPIIELPNNKVYSWDFRPKKEEIILTTESFLKCVICEEPIEPNINGWKGGNNPFPVSEHGRCCDSCDVDVVLKARLQNSGFSEQQIDSIIAVQKDMFINKKPL
tara:strand:+ start:12576 stop:12911 length:336 start_codon:yes stop_codon:yes gene_type:complete